MSSRVLPGTAGAAPITWRQAGSAPVVATLQEPAGSRSAPPEPTAEEITARIEAEVSRRTAEAYQRGLREGAAAGERNAMTQIEPWIARLAQTIEGLASAGRSLRREAESDVVRLAVAIARRILNRELSVDPDALLGLVRAAVTQLDLRETHRVRVHPGDAGRVSAELAKLSPAKPIEVIADASLDRGAALFETARGTFDASASTQLDEIDRGLADAVRRRG
jgi:flagellar assembly protein FliH